MKKLDPFFISLLLRVNGLIIILTSKFILRVLYILKHKIMVLSVLLNIHGVSRLPPKVWGTFYGKEGVLHGGTNDQIMLRESIANGFSSNISTVNLKILGNLKVNTRNRGLNLKCTFCTLCL